MTANHRRRRMWTVLFTVLLSAVLFLTVASAAGLALAPAGAAPAQPAGRAAYGDGDLFSRRDAATLQPYYHALLPLVPKSVYPYYHAVVTTGGYLAGAFAFGSILSCVLAGLVILTRRA